MIIRKIISFFNLIKIIFLKKKYIEKEIDIEKKFSIIYKTNYWASRESKSGTGSTLDFTENIRKELEKILNKFEINKILDLPCGDFYWMKEFLKNKKINYIGADIVPELIKVLNEKHEDVNIKFKKLDIIKDKLPNADILFCRDCIIHFSNEDIFKTLKNFVASNIKYLFISHTINNNKFVNKDIITGEYRMVDLFSKPFNLPRETIINIIDYPADDKGKDKRHMSMWSKDQIIEILDKKKNE